MAAQSTDPVTPIGGGTLEAVTTIDDCGCCQQRSGSGQSGTGSGGSGSDIPTVQTSCCDHEIPIVLFATVVGCDGGTYQLDYVGGGVWEKQGGSLCAAEDPFLPHTQLIGLQCDETSDWRLNVHDALTTGNLITFQCNPFIAIFTVNMDIAGCTCGTVTITITE